MVDALSIDEINEQNAIRYFTLIRDYMKHEDSLVNYRTTWFITIQSFLIAAFGITFQKTAGLLALSAATAGASALIVENYRWLLTVFLIAGLGTSIIAWFAIRAATNAIGALEKKWTSSPYFETYGNHLPGVVGGGHPNAHILGKSFALWLPPFFVTFWVIVGTSLYIIGFAQLVSK